MSKHRHLSRAPIREAVIDIQVLPSVSLDLVEKAAETILPEFQRRSKIWHTAVAVTLNQAGTTVANENRVSASTQIGVRLDSADAHHVVQLKTNGFSLSRLPPYEDWETMAAKAEELWKAYVAVTNPGQVIRLATRYINAIPLPLPILDFSEYLEVAPDVPPALPQTLASFLQRYVIVGSNPTRIAAVTQALEGSAEVVPQSITVLLDIDASLQVRLTPTSPDVWSTLQALRVFKNDIFFEYLTDKALDQFQ